MLGVVGLSPRPRAPGTSSHVSDWASSPVSHPLHPSQVALLFPEEGLVFDYRLEDGGISSTSDDEDEEEEGKQVTEAWSQGQHGEQGGEGGGQVVAVLLNGCREEALLMATGVMLGLFASSHESSQTHRVVTSGSISQTRKLGLRTVTPS